jgi:segregation and condensation protein A
MAAIAEHGVGEGASPELCLDGFAGPLDFLLRVARARQVDLAVLPILDLVEQLAQALQRAPARLPLGQKADWLVMGAWILLLRSQLLLPPETPAQAEAAVEAGQLRDRLLALQDAQALAAWLERRPILGHDVFARGWEEYPGGFGDVRHCQVDVIGFLWACLDVFGTAGDVTGDATHYAPAPPPNFSMTAAITRIRAQLAARAPRPLTALLPAYQDEAGLSQIRLKRRRRAALCSSFAACLELGKQGEVDLQQDEVFGGITVALALQPIAGTP